VNLKYGKRIKKDIREGLEVSYKAGSRERKRLAEKMKSDPKIKKYFVII